MSHKLIVALLAGLLFAARAFAASPAYNTGSTAQCNTVDTTVCTFSAYTATDGGFSVVGVRISTPGDVLLSVSDGVNTYSSICTSQTVGVVRVYWYAATNTASGSVTVTITLSSVAFIWGVLGHYTGAATSSALEDVECGQGGSSTTHTSSTVTTTDVDRRILAILGTGTGAVASIAPNSGETERQEIGSSRFQLEDKAAATATNYTASWALGSSDTALYMAAALKPAAGGGGGGTSKSPLNGPLGGPLGGPL